MSKEYTVYDTYLPGNIVLHVKEEDKKRILSEFPAPKLSKGEEAFDIKSIAVGSAVNNLIVLVNSFSVEPTANGSYFLKMQFGNNAGSFGAKMWDKNGSVHDVAAQMESYKVFKISGKVEQFPAETGAKTILVGKIQPYDGEIEAFDLLPSTSKSIEDLTIELVTYLEELASPFKEICLKGLKKYWSHFSKSPAAIGHHHAYLGGLLKHTVGLLRLARYIRDEKSNPFDAMNSLIDMSYSQERKESLNNLSKAVPLKDRDMVWKGVPSHLRDIFDGFIRTKDVELDFNYLNTSILYHDIGKILVYTYVGEDVVTKYSWLYPDADFSAHAKRKDGGISMDPIGSRTEHIVLSIMMLREVIVSEKIVLSIDEIERLNHAIAAHHGKLEWGSAVRMASPESYLIHFVDYIDSRWENADGVEK